MKRLLLYIFLLIFGYGYSQYTQIPDEVFEQYLINLGIDTEGVLDGQVLTDDIDHITSLAMSPDFPEVDPLIHDLTGIEGFVALESLNFGGNAVVNVDLSQNTQLRTLVCKLNSLESLDLSNNLLLELLDAGNCPPGLCPNSNKFSALDLSSNINLKSIFVNYNDFFQTLNLSNNPSLETVSIGYCPQLDSLNVRNGNNLILDFFAVIENPMLDCLTVDDPDAATAGDTFPYDQWNIQEGVIFSDDCSLGINEHLARNTVLYPNPSKRMINIMSSSGFEIERISVMNNLGQTLLTFDSPPNQIDLQTLSSGLYTFMIDTDMGTTFKQVIKY